MFFSMSFLLTGDEFEKIRDDFLLIDRDGDGQLTREEMLEVLEDKKEENLDFMMRLMDTDSSGTVEFHEFLEIMAFLNFDKGLNKRSAGQFFRALDKDGDGYLTVAEIQYFYEMIGTKGETDPSREEIEVLVKDLDTDGDGKIDFEEFLNGINKFEI